MAKSSKLVAAKRGRVLLVRRKRDGAWMFPGGRKRERESDKDCLRREIKEELPKLKLGRLRLWKEVKAKNRRSGRKMSDAIFVAAKAAGRLTIGDKKEIDKATWRKPRGIRLTPTSRYIRDKLFPKSNSKKSMAAMTIPLHMKGRNTVLKFSAECNAARGNRQLGAEVARSGTRREGDRQDDRSRRAARRSPAATPAHQGADRVS
jgi:8-oxo-dGTP diphosphatase